MGRDHVRDKRGAQENAPERSPFPASQRNRATIWCVFVTIRNCVEVRVVYERRTHVRPSDLSGARKGQRKEDRGQH